MSDARETPQPTVLVRAAAFEALLARGLDSFTEADLDDALSWLAEPARSETLHALRRSGWLEVGPAGLWTPTEAGLQVYDALRAAAQAGLPYPGLPAGLTPDQIVRALLGRSLEELATAGRDALVPILSAAPLLTTPAVARAAEAYALQGRPEPE
ncbi:MAG TPA: hypothetical protein VN493_30535 [Thermoanaerobaculia bacterium]|nr:hypothetical protein [Thermoanaerobaculia bacterium]